MHESEYDYSTRVAAFLEEVYGEENVEYNKYLKESGRFVDFWVEAPVVTLAIEVENDFAAAIKGVGQALLYASHENRAVPVVILPPGHVQEPEVNMLRSHVAIIELDV